MTASRPVQARASRTAARRRVRAGLREAHALGARDEVDDPLGDLDLDRVRKREGDPVAELTRDRLVDRRVACPRMTGPSAIGKSR